MKSAPSAETKKQLFERIENKADAHYAKTANMERVLRCMSAIDNPATRLSNMGSRVIRRIIRNTGTLRSHA
jgi:hypothetical protein